jgi:ribosomal protein L7/L12
MRIRLFSAFASNNSGSYTIVGRFADEATAAEVARIAQEASDAHDAWHSVNEWDDTGPAPLDDFVRAQGLREARHGRGDDWPCHGAKPSVLAVGRQVMVYAPYTVTLPPVFGELFYAKGGRVEVELEHTHDPIAVEFAWYPKDLSYGDPRLEPALDAFEALVRPELAPLIARPGYDPRPPVPPAWHRGSWGQRHLSVVFGDLLAGVQAVRSIADACGMNLTLRLTECPHEVEDPFALLRLPTVSSGLHRVILWGPGPNRVAAMRALREVMACGLDEAKAMLDGLPKEVLVDVSERYAEGAATVLSGAGCEAEVVAPKR